jgi:hypothetical protein
MGEEGITPGAKAHSLRSERPKAKALGYLDATAKAGWVRGYIPTLRKGREGWGTR